MSISFKLVALLQAVAVLAATQCDARWVSHADPAEPGDWVTVIDFNYGVELLVVGTITDKSESGSDVELEISLGSSVMVSVVNGAKMRRVRMNTPIRESFEMQWSETCIGSDCEIQTDFWVDVGKGRTSCRFPVDLNAEMVSRTRVLDLGAMDLGECADSGQ